MKPTTVLALLLAVFALPAGGRDEDNWVFLGFSRDHTASLRISPDSVPAALQLQEHVELDLLESDGVMVQSIQEIVANCPAGTLQRGKHHWEYGHSFQKTERLPIPDPVEIVVDASPRVPSKGSYDELVLQVACSKRGEGAQAGRPRHIWAFMNAELINYLKTADPSSRLPTAQGIAISGDFTATVSGETHPVRAHRALRAKCADAGLECAQIFLSRRCLALAEASQGVIPGFGDNAKAAADAAMAACKGEGGTGCALRSEAMCP
ncbi:hypothetical protein [Lysobacter humi (ex Lee et al. 2017)]